MKALISCPGCGVALDLDAVQPRPGKECPVCRKPLDETALESVTNHTSQNPSDPRDAARLAAKAQLKADVDAIQAEHQAAKAEVAAGAVK